MMPKRPVLNMRNGLTNGKMHLDSGQTNTPERGYNSFFCYTKRAGVRGRGNLHIASCKFQYTAF